MNRKPQLIIDGYDHVKWHELHPNDRVLFCGWSQSSHGTAMVIDIDTLHSPYITLFKEDQTTERYKPHELAVMYWWRQTFSNLDKQKTFKGYEIVSWKELQPGDEIRYFAATNGKIPVFFTHMATVNHIDTKELAHSLEIMGKDGETKTYSIIEVEKQFWWRKVTKKASQI